MTPSSAPPIAATPATYRPRPDFTPTLTILMSGLAYHTCVDGPAGLATSSLGALSGVLALVALYLLGAVGEGEIKLMAGLGSWLGLPLSLHLFSGGALVSGAYALALMGDGAIVFEAILGLRSRGLRLPGLPICWAPWTWLLPPRDGADPDHAAPPPPGGW